MMEDKGVTICVPMEGSQATANKFIIQRDFEQMNVRPTEKAMADFILNLESSAREIGFLAKDDNILTVQTAKDDAGNSYLVAVLKSCNTSPTVASAHNGTGQVVPIGSTRIGNGNHQDASAAEAESDGETHHLPIEAHTSPEVTCVVESDAETQLLSVESDAESHLLSVESDVETHLLSVESDAKTHLLSFETYALLEATSVVESDAETHHLSPEAVEAAGVVESDVEIDLLLAEAYASLEAAASVAESDAGTHHFKLEHYALREVGGVAESDRDTHHVSIESYASPETADVELSNNTSDESNDESRNITAIPAPSDDGDVENRASSDQNETVELTNMRGVLIRVTVERLSRFFNVRRRELTKHLDISGNCFKKTITQLGLKRWPSRKMGELEHAIEGLEFAIAKGGFRKPVVELRRTLNSVQRTKDQLQHGSLEVINRLVKSKKVLPPGVRNFLDSRVHWRFRECTARPSSRNQVMEVFAVERSIPESVGSEISASGAHEAAGGTADNTAPLVAESSRGRKRLSRAAKGKAVFESAGPSAKRFKGEGSRALAIQEKADSGPSISEEY